MHHICKCPFAMSANTLTGHRDWGVDISGAIILMTTPTYNSPLFRLVKPNVHLALAMLWQLLFTGSATDSI